MLSVKRFEFNPFEENTYLVYDDARQCIVIDPGCSDQEEESVMMRFISSNELKIVMLINTHCHIDHVLGNAFIKNQYHVKLWIHEKEEPLLKSVKAYAPNYGFYRYSEAIADEYLKEGDFVELGSERLEILFVPGHSPGHIALYHKESKVVLGGDVLFRNSIGRTDLPGGDYNTLIRSIHTKLFTLPDDVTVYCGHGPETTIGYEKRTNPFCALDTSLA